jgi:hypothetical protein
MLSWIDSRVAKDDSYWSRWKRGTKADKIVSAAKKRSGYGNDETYGTYA